ncbi:hypothetical protein BDY19DRAFT_1048650 [Irpex rosettiformis]|uniref:Uncharacterized protein n=1 Tax=Irpex rosettiformis TaxID=378272 RepID=A0ACB8U319_9APHY|nr:hypothetical protein BDY19DRAFT_1048650 [Irpex rosettiformis]
MMTTNDTYSLLSLLPSTPYKLAYTLPLFLFSLLLTTAGCFLILDRTRSFSPIRSSQVASPEQQPPLFRLYPLHLGGGIGGLCAGYAFGVHLSTFLSVVLPNVTLASFLGHKAFLAIWVVSALVCMSLGGKWKYVALALTGISGYCTLALSITIITHPPLLSRIILSAIFVTIGTILILLPFPHCSRITLRIASSSLGAFGVVLSIALFCKSLAWGDVWDRFYLHDGLTWGSSTERGLSAVWCLLFLGGTACDWYLHRRIGENPDEKWDTYLSDYTTELPNSPRPAGSFKPLVSWWDKLVGRHGPFAPVVPHHQQDKELLFPAEADIKRPIVYHFSPTPSSSTPTHGAIGRLEKMLGSRAQQFATATVPESKLRFALLHRKTSRRTHHTTPRRTSRIKFNPNSFDSDSDSEERSVPDALGSVAPPTDSLVTLVESHRTPSPLRGQFQPWEVKYGEVPECSDVEDVEMDIVNITAQPVPVRSIDRKKDGKVVEVGKDGERWQPTFIRQHCTPSPPHQPTLSLDLPSVPVSPSLIKAVERIQRAHALPPPSSTPVAPPAPFIPESVSSQVVTAGVSRSPSGDSEHNRHLQHRRSWDAFWREVKTKAHR